MRRSKRKFGGVK